MSRRPRLHVIEAWPTTARGPDPRRDHVIDFGVQRCDSSTGSQEVMITLSLEPTDEEILAAVESWVELLATGDFASAFAQVGARAHWTAELMERVVTNYGDPTREPGPHRVTSPAGATGSGTHEVDRFADGTIEAWYDLPLDGEWSDLTVTMTVSCRETDSMLELHDIHIM